MDRVEEIEAALHDLPVDDFRRLAQWFREFEQGRWDAQMDADSSAGKLDFVFDEAGPRRMGDRADPQRTERIGFGLPVPENLGY